MTDDDAKAKHAAYMRKYTKARYASDPEFRAAVNARTKAWRERNLEREMEKARGYYYANRDRQLAQAKERMKDPRRRQIRVARSHAFARGYKLRHTPEEWEARKAEFGNACHWCKRTDVTLERDHYPVPVVDGDPQTVDLIANIVPSCKSCNSARGRAAQLAQ